MADESSELTTPLDNLTPASATEIAFSRFSPTSLDTDWTSYEPSITVDVFIPTQPQQTNTPLDAAVEIVDTSATGTVHHLSIPPTTHNETIPEDTVHANNIPRNQRVILHFIKWSVISLVIVTLAVSLTMLGAWLLCQSTPNVCAVTSRLQRIIVDATLFIFACALTTEIICAVAFLASTVYNRYILKRIPWNRDLTDISTLSARPGEWECRHR